eukprot:CAMPEP_0181245064 /NCGR_PEP_ID=MMETSP1096-20121128/43211_1 /TAXON_ID=156174 ORGANISM="Chrysochromulina ericina, Strain CCMP281" /NCGR_SAMPLE_ID=MMETSP1096 /ASSEMBLY_ACC=CAM_ASM_000453 /LENGTH=114 /DNA_ID=CAMNT_0023341689 /DNA_START=290 /DNA_END=635 /DNA_ORIENTATION=-
MAAVAQDHRASLLLKVNPQASLGFARLYDELLQLRHVRAHHLGYVLAAAQHTECGQGRDPTHRRDLFILVDIDLCEDHAAHLICQLGESGGDPLTGTAPAGPEIDNDQLIFCGL